MIPGYLANRYSVKFLLRPLIGVPNLWKKPFIQYKYLLCNSFTKTARISNINLFPLVSSPLISVGAGRKPHEIMFVICEAIEESVDPC